MECYNFLRLCIPVNDDNIDHSSEQHILYSYVMNYINKKPTLIFHEELMFVSSENFTGEVFVIDIFDISTKELTKIIEDISVLLETYPFVIEK